MRTLIVVDVQNDFVNGSLGSADAQAIIPNVKKKIQEYYNRGDEIIFTRDTHDITYLNTSEGRKLPVKHCIYGTKGWKIVDGLEVPNCRYVDKTTFGTLVWTGMTWISKGAIELIGLDSDICVISNALILKVMFPETEITVDASCCAGSTPERHKAALEVMKSCQINVIGEE